MNTPLLIQQLTDQELQETINLYGSIADHNSIAQIIIKIYQKEINEREN
jgi:hypothetical protein